MNQAYFKNFCNNWIIRDTEVANKHYNSNPKVKAKFIQGLVKQGLSHSNQNTGFFNDQYQRCARIKDPNNSLLYMVIKSLSIKFSNNNSYLVPISDLSLANNVCSANHPHLNHVFKYIIKTIDICEREFICIEAIPNNDIALTEQHIFDLLTFIGNWGILATQDKLIQILLGLDIIRYDSQHDIQLNSSIVEYYQTVNVSKIFKLLRQAPRMAENLNINDAECYEFYCSYLENLIKGLLETIKNRELDLSLTDKILIEQAYGRLIFKLSMMQDSDSDYKQRVTAIEFAFDDITSVLSTLKLYNKNDLFNSIKRFIADNARLSQEEMPEYVCLAGSCMQIIHKSILSAEKYFCSDNSKKELRVYFPSDCYYEICMTYGIIQDFKHAQYVTLCDSRIMNIHKYNDEIVDVMLLHFHANVNRMQRGFYGHDLEALIKKQFKLREDIQECGQLIVVLDVAMTNLSDIFIKKLLISFKKHISEGKLAIIMATSLNKYIQLGFDRFPSGLSSIFYAPKNFIGLSAGNQLIGFEENDSIPQTVTHFLKYSETSVLTFYRMIHASARFIHDILVPKHLYNSSQPIHIDSPFSNDGYNRPWGFLVIRFADIDIASRYIIPKLHLLLDKIGFDYRNGFGFNRSTYAFIGENLEILRISIGPNASAKQYQQLIDFIVLENKSILSQDQLYTSQQDDNKIISHNIKYTKTFF